MPDSVTPTQMLQLLEATRLQLATKHHALLILSRAARNVGNLPLAKQYAGQARDQLALLHELIPPTNDDKLPRQEFVLRRDIPPPED